MANQHSMKSTMNFTFSDLADSEEFRELHQTITDLTGIPMSLADAQGNEARPFCPPSKFNPACKLIRTTQEGCDRCRETDYFHNQQAASENKGYYYTCHAGMIDFVVPITIQGKRVGVINGGQIFSEPPTEEGFVEFRDKLIGVGLDDEQLREAYFRNPYMTHDKIEAFLKLLSHYAEYFCEVGTRLKESQKDQKYPEVAKAKNFIKAQFRETITLKNVADYVLLSEGHFSRLFHRIEGVTFSQYLQTVRLEEAKKLLTRTDWSISQIAFSVGFSCLPYFNQFFKKIEACTPSQYRVKYQEDA